MIPAAFLRHAEPADAQAIAQLRVESWRATYRGMIPDAYLDGMKVDDSAKLWHRVLSAPPNRTSTLVAEDVVGLVGFGAGLMLPEPKHGLDAELSAIYVRPGQHRAGVGRRLVGMVPTTQRSFGATGMIVWAIAANRGARAFYEALGGELLIEQPFQWDGMDLMEAGYGWRDLDALAAACGPLVAPAHKRHHRLL